MVHFSNGLRRDNRCARFAREERFAYSSRGLRPLPLGHPPFKMDFEKVSAPILQFESSPAIRRQRAV
jgi:hypothetical protein